MNRIVILGALLLALPIPLAGCASKDSTGSAPKVTISAVKADAKTAVTSFCTDDLSPASLVVEHLNEQVQKDFATVSAACADIGNGKSINWVTAGVAVFDLYEGIKAVYPKALP